MSSAEPAPLGPAPPLPPGPASPVQEATAGYRAEIDPLAGFLDDHCVLHDGAQVPVPVLYEAYVDWCTANGAEPVSKGIYGGRLRRRGLEQREGGGVRYWRGIGLQSQPAQLDWIASGAECEVFAL